jgi:hypothetical protein
MDEACVDCYDEHEQSTGLTTAVEHELQFPFRAEVLGEEVEVVDVCSPKHDPLGLDLVVVHKKKRYAIAAHCVELRKPLPEGRESRDCKKLETHPARQL